MPGSRHSTDSDCQHRTPIPQWKPHKKTLEPSGLSETSFNKYTTYQGGGMGVRGISKENEDSNGNNKTETYDSTEGSFSEY